jgi:hypothetical protein
MRSQLELLAFIARFNKTFSKYTPAQIITATLLTVFLLWKFSHSLFYL